MARKAKGGLFLTEAKRQDLEAQRWFAKLTQRCIRRGSHRSTLHLKRAIGHYLDNHNADPKPFAWTKATADILASIQRLCLRTSNPQHQEPFGLWVECAGRFAGPG